MTAAMASSGSKDALSPQLIAQALVHLQPFEPSSYTSNSDSPAPRGANQIASAHVAHATGEHQSAAAESYIDNGTSEDRGHTEQSIPRLETVIARIHARVQAFLAESHPPDSLLASVQQQTRISLGVVAEALKRYEFSEISLSYNGGKDCLVLLILFLAGLHPTNTTPQDTHAPSTEPASPPALQTIPSIYALPPDPFQEVEDFVRSSAVAYHLSITKYTTSPPSSTLRSSFEDYLSRHPDIRAIFVGTRRTDPHGAKLTHFDRTDHGWPDFMRVHPVIDWQYAEIWAFIRHLGLRYCSLYDDGYTSLGGTSDTLPNPRLNKGSQYLPAYELKEDLEERLGRN
ncbi:hypothetical protein N7468_003669 [Penicillium chermesinum]|uniref:FAD synthase n=1 Tax=Penicillium chermesinum TaxID=63820 RepID=A0A9W9TRU4_9EURO|nr:uncharacterized protein N7468_003669 [Penicillium chermesinum]KAJ5239050.1 hypothetical protein N7468_003669 [Penicillium chermesinum]KAJ6164690.1 hypothetical protein N7470_003362 [Penicillium chermesinum]